MNGWMNRWICRQTDVGWGLRAETAQSALPVILRSVISGLTSTILAVLGTISLPLYGQFVPIL